LPRQVSLRPEPPALRAVGITDDGLAFSKFGKEASLRVVIVGAGFGELLPPRPAALPFLKLPRRHPLVLVRLAHSITNSHPRS